MGKSQSKSQKENGNEEKTAAKLHTSNPPINMWISLISGWKWVFLKKAVLASTNWTNLRHVQRCKKHQVSYWEKRKIVVFQADWKADSMWREEAEAREKSKELTHCIPLSPRYASHKIHSGWILTWTLFLLLLMLQTSQETMTWWQWSFCTISTSATDKRLSLPLSSTCIVDWSLSPGGLWSTP